MHLPQDVTGLLEALLPSIRDALGDNLVGMYLRRSLAMGDLIPDTSDIDILAVTERHVNDAEFTMLADLHAHFAALPHPYANRLEIAYIDRAAVWRFESGLCHPILGQGESLAWSEHRANWILERWTMRDCGVTLFGPDPRTRIDLISVDILRAAVRSRLRDWADWADQPDDPDSLLPRSHKAYVVETMCRALAALACIKLLSKPRAVAWALAALPEPWRSLLEQSQAWRSDDAPEPAIVPSAHGRGVARG